MDVFSEQIVAVRKSPAERFIQIGVIVSGILLIILCGAAYVSGILGSLSILLGALAAGTVYGMWFFTSRLNIEYEYLVTNGEIDVDKITAKRSRLRVMNQHLRSINEFGKYNSDSFANRTFDYRVVACTVDEDARYAVFSDDGEETLLIFAPNKKVLGAMKKYAPRHIDENEAVS